MNTRRKIAPQEQQRVGIRGVPSQFGRRADYAKAADRQPSAGDGFLGYHVGEMQPTPRAVRWRVLEYAFEYHLPTEWPSLLFR
jgi:hypothetical protein